MRDSRSILTISVTDKHLTLKASSSGIHPFVISIGSHEYIVMTFGEDFTKRRNMNDWIEVQTTK